MLEQNHPTTAGAAYTSKSVLAQTSTRTLLALYEQRTVSGIADELGSKLNATERNRFKKAVWRRLKEAGYQARPSGEAVSKAKVGRARKILPLKAHPGEGPADKWKIVALKVAGKSEE